MIEFKMPSLGADMEAGILREWKIAPGQKITDLQIKDLLPNNLQFTAVNLVTGNGTGATTPISVPSTLVPGGNLTYEFDQAIGTPAPTDAQLHYSFYIPRDDASGNPVRRRATRQRYP